jgi:hypothetical protein
MIDTAQTNNFILYSTKESNINVQILVDKKSETIWLSQKRIAEIFDVNVPAITKHISNILADGELDSATISTLEIVQKEGTRNIKRKIEHYNLDMIISIGYRVNSKKATQFRIWATKKLKEFIIKGFVLDDERLKQGNNVFNKNYFDELLERIREIRASEKLFYEKVKDVFALSVDYDSTSNESKNFFAHCQNKLEYAIVGMTSAEIIKARANHNLPNMGLTSWSGKKRDKKPIQKDITIAKNYLNEDEIKNLNRLTTMLLDYVEDQTKKGIIFHMKDWINKLDKFLEFNEYEVLQNYGKVTKSLADKLVKGEYKKYKEIDNKNYMNELDKK